MKKIQCSLIAICFSLTVLAQKDTSIFKSRQFVLMFGVQVSNFNNLNSVLTANNYKSINNINYVSGFGYNMCLKRFIFCPSVNSANNLYNKNNTSVLRIIDLNISAGCAYVLKKQFQMYGIVGINVNATTISESKNATQQINFNSYVTSPSNQINLIGNNYNAIVETRANFISKINSAFGEKPVYGIRIGYQIPLGSTSWKVNNTKLESGPNINLGNFYATLVWGWTIGRRCK